MTPKKTRKQREKRMTIGDRQWSELDEKRTGWKAEKLGQLVVRVQK
jgi:hypothetical protein